MVNGCYVEVPWNDTFIPKISFTLEAWVRVDWTATDPHALRFVVDSREISPAAAGFGLEYGWVAELEDLYVLPTERRKGIARRLIDLVVGWAADRGCSAVLVTVTPVGERSHGLSAFYERLGFADRGRRLLERPVDERPGG